MEEMNRIIVIIVRQSVKEKVNYSTLLSIPEATRNVSSLTSQNEQQMKLGTTERATLALTNAIHDEVYKSGQRLIEAELTRELGISRGSLREVLRRLAANGLIDLEPNRGAVVKRISRESVMEILTTREVLEGLAAFQAAENIGEQGNKEKVLEVLERIQQMQRDRADIDFLADNSNFHHFIIELSGNKVLQQQIEQLQLPGIRSRFFSQVSEVMWQRSLREHEILLETILEGDTILAEQLMRAHVRRSRRHFAALPEALYDS
jgi:DNA-binding GntR family transcriptional regulator